MSTGELRDMLSGADRQSLLRFVTEGIHGFTVMNRDPELSDERKADINNRIHYLAGRLLTLLDHNIELSESDLNDIVTQVSGMNQLLYRNMIERMTG